MESLRIKVVTEDSSLAALEARVARLRKGSGTIAVSVDKDDIKRSVETVRLATGEMAKITKQNGRTMSIALQEAGKSAHLLGDSLGNIVAKMAAWQVLGALIAKPLRELREAVQEMKNVDTAMVTIQKVTGATADEMEHLADTAYDVAAALGTTASTYLDAVAEFSKAGYADQAEALGELAIMAANVGDTTQEVANQYLLAVDKAYQFNGSIEQLTRTLDGANEIGNRYATDVEHLAEGLGTIAPLASQAHVGVDELTAAIGTITAVTQRSGTEAARALRALFLNIMGDTKTEIDEGVTWTTGEIAGLRDVLKLYASDVVEAADATHTLIDPMEAIGALAQSMKDGVLTEQKLMEMVSDIGGKLRTSQLLALIQNWDMYQEMLNTYATAAGSAAEEYAIYLDSWEAKTNQLSATWTKFISNLVETKAIKGTIDALTAAIEFLDSGFTKFAFTVGSVTAAFALLQKAMKGLKATEFISKLSAMIKGAEGLNVALATLTKTMWASPLFKVAAGVAVIYGIIKAVDALNVTYEEQIEILNNLNAEYEEKFGAGSEYADLIARENELTDVEKAQLEVLKAQNEAMREKIRNAEQTAVDKFRNQKVRVGDASYGYNEDGEWEYASGWISQTAANVEALTEALEGNYDTLEDQKDALSDVISEYEDYYDKLVEWQDKGIELTDEEQQLIDLYEEAAAKLNEVAEATDNATNAMDRQAASADSVYDIITRLKERYQVLAQAQDEMNQTGYVSIDTLEKIITKYPELQEYLVKTENGYVLTKGALDKYIDSQRTLYEDALSNAQSAANTVTSTESQKKTAYDNTTRSILLQAGAMQHLAAGVASVGQAISSIGSGKKSVSAFSVGSQIASSLTNIKTAKDSLSNFNTAIEMLGREFGGGGGGSSKGGGGGGKKGSGSSGSGSGKDEELERLKAIVALRKSELDLMEERGDSTDDQIAKMKEIQSALHDEAQYLRNNGGDQEDINKLSKEWWSIQNDINKLLEDAAKELEDMRKELKDELGDAIDKTLDKAKAARDDALAAIDAELDALKQEKETKEDQLALEEKILAVQEAEAALANAQAERNVRYFNAATGQWEWGANAQNVKSAQDALEKAQQDLSDYQEDLAYEAAVAALEDKKNAIERTYDLLEESWDKLTESLEDPTRDISEILADLAANGTPEMAAQVNKINGLLGDLAAYIGNATKYTEANTAYKSSIAGSGGGGGGGGGGGTGGIVSAMMANSAAWFDADADTKAALAEANYEMGTSLGWTRGDDGAWYTEDRTRAYDSGGILRGIGGIKATREPEGVIPPDITKKMLSLGSDSIFKQRMNELRFIYGSGGSGANMAGAAGAKIGSQHNGDVYSFGNISLSEQQARGMSVYDLAQMSKRLSIYRTAV